MIDDSFVLFKAVACVAPHNGKNPKWIKYLRTHLFFVVCGFNKSIKPSKTIVQISILKDMTNIQYYVNLQYNFLHDYVYYYMYIIKLKKYISFALLYHEKNIEHSNVKAELVYYYLVKI